MDIKATLKNLDYSYIQFNIEKILQDSTKKALEKEIGEMASKELVSFLSSSLGLSEDEFLAKHELMINKFQDLLGNVGKKIIQQSVKEELVKRITSYLTVDDILQIVREVEIMKFIRQIGSHQHIVLLYKNNSVKDRLLFEFLDPSATGETPKGLFSVKPISLNYVKNMVYDELLGMEKSQAMKKMGDWLSELHSSNKSDTATRVGGEDTWFFENGFDQEILNLEKAIGPHVPNEMNILCTYNISKITDNKIIDTLIRTHGYVIIDDPLTVFKKETK